MARRAGLSTVVLNPGVPTDPLYRELGVAICTFEGSWPEYRRWSGEGAQPGDTLVVRILDLEFVRKAEDGTVTAVEIGDFDGDGTVDLRVFEGASSGLIGEGDIESAGEALQPGSAAAMLLFENRWAAPFATAMRRAGGQLAAFERIPVQAVLASLEATEAHT